MARLSPDSPLARLLAQFPRSGQVRWIGLRPARAVAMQSVDEAEAVTGRGLVGDRYMRSAGAGGNGKRGITLIQAEHLPTIAALSGREVVEASGLRRNIVVAGIPLIALKDRRFRIGQVLLEGTGPCDPCSQMEAALGPGGYNAMRGHGGICARIVEGGRLRIGDPVTAVDAGFEPH